MRFQLLIAVVAVAELALWIPQCGDTVGILGSEISDTFQALNSQVVSDINTIFAGETYTVTVANPLPPPFTWTTEDNVRLVKTTGNKASICGSLQSKVAYIPGSDAFQRTATPSCTLSSAITATGGATSLTTRSATSPLTTSSCYSTGAVITDSGLVAEAALSLCQGALSHFSPGLSLSQSYVFQTVVATQTMRLEIANARCTDTIRALAPAVEPEYSTSASSLVRNNTAVYYCWHAIYDTWSKCG